MNITFQAIHAGHYSQLMQLWTRAGQLAIRETDTPEALEKFLARNPNCSFAASSNNQLIGAVLAGHDGWRGYLYHMAVSPEYRGRRIGRQLVERAVEAIRKKGIPKIHCMVLRENISAQKFWISCGFEMRLELIDFSSH